MGLGSGELDGLAPVSAELVGEFGTDPIGSDLTNGSGFGKTISSFLAALSLNLDCASSNLAERASSRDLFKTALSSRFRFRSSFKAEKIVKYFSNQNNLY